MFYAWCFFNFKDDMLPFSVLYLIKKNISIQQELTSIFKPKAGPSFHQMQTVALHKSRIMFIWFSLLGKSPKCSPPIPWSRRSGWPGERNNRTSCSPSRGSRRSAGRPGRTRQPACRLARNVRDPENLLRDEIPKRLPVNNPWTRFIQGKILANCLRIKF